MRGIRIAGWLMLCWITFSAWAAAPGSSRDSARAVIEQVMDLSGMSHQVAQFAQLAQSDLEQRRANGMLGGMDEASLQRIKTILAEALDPARLHEAMVTALRQRYDAAKFEAAVGLLNTGLALKMTRLEVQASTVEGQQAMQRYAMTLQTILPSTERVKATQALLEAAGAVDVAIQASSAMIEGMMHAMAPWMPAEHRPQPEQIEQQLAQIQQQMRPAAQEGLLVQALYTYRDVSVEELAEYAQLYHSETGCWLTDIVSAALIEVLETSMNDFTQRMVREFPPPEKTS